jgi:hypothetical protein
VTVSRTVVPGDWYGVLGDNVIVLLPPEAKARVAALWETVDEGASFDEVLDALISGGLRSLPGFVLVSGEGRDVKVVIRGAGEAELTTKDGTLTVSGSTDTTWVEQNIAGVTGLIVRVAPADGAAYTVGSGLVRVGAVEHPARGATVIASPDAEAVAVPIEPRSPAPSPTAPPAFTEPEPGPGPEPEPEPPARILPPDPQLEAERLAAEQAAEQAAEAAAQSPITEPLVETPSVAPIPGVPVPVTGPLDLPGFDPLTSPELAVPRSGSGGESAETTAGEAVARLIFSSGEVVDVDRAVVVGRAPEHGRFGNDEQTRLVTVPSPHQEISSTHLEIRPGTGADHGSAVVTDLGSTNGTVVAQPGLPAEDLRPGIAVQVVPGATIDLGEGVTIQVTQV